MTTLVVATGVGILIVVVTPGSVLVTLSILVDGTVSALLAALSVSVTLVLSFGRLVGSAVEFPGTVTVVALAAAVSVPFPSTQVHVVTSGVWPNGHVPANDSSQLKAHYGLNELFLRAPKGIIGILGDPNNPGSASSSCAFTIPTNSGLSGAFWQ